MSLINLFYNILVQLYKVLPMQLQTIAFSFARFHIVIACNSIALRAIPPEFQRFCPAFKNILFNLNKPFENDYLSYAYITIKQVDFI